MIKTYTDIEQSKKLAEILLFESADMIHYGIHLGLDQNYHLSGDFTEEYIISIRKDMITKVFDKVTDSDLECQLPCWSLAALLDVLPLEIETHKQTDEYKIYYYVESYMKRKGKEIYLSTERHENLVDACYEIILKLNELNLL